MGKNSSIKLKTTKWLKSYVSENGKEIIVEDYYQKRKFVFKDIYSISLLEYAIDFRTERELKRLILNKFGLDDNFSTPLINELKSLNLLINLKSDSYKLEKQSKLWVKYGWADALEYFISIKDYPFLDYESPEASYVDNEMMSRYIKGDPVPSVYKNYPKVKKIKLENSNLINENIGDLLLDKVFEIYKGNRILKKEQISNLLFFSFGEMAKIEFPLQGKFLLKTSPSGGARHPLEAYLITFKTGFDAGVYHYSVYRNSLEKLNIKLEKSEFMDLVYELKTGPIFPIKAVILISAVYPRSMWRYREPRSYRVILHDLGHLLENIKIIAKNQHVNTYFGHGFWDTKIEKKLNLDSDTESILKFIALG